MIISSTFISWMDRFAVSTSTVCGIHCLCLPLVLGVFPAIGTTLFGEEAFHVWLLWAVIPLSLLALSLGCQKHKNMSVLAIGLVGLTFLIIAASIGHDVVGESGERTVTLFGAITIAVGHFRNFKLCRQFKCDH